MKQKILTLFFVVFMMMAVFSMNSAAAETEELPMLEQMTGFSDVKAFAAAAQADEVEYIDAGYFGRSVIWAVTNDGILVIGGEGTMRDSERSWGTNPWSKYRSSIYAVVVLGTVNNIGEYAFYDLQNLTVAVIENGVKSIDGGAFYDCINLKVVELPDSITEIEYDAFYNCGITEIKLPKNLKTISNGAFALCDQLVKIDIPNTVETIEAFAFSGAGLKTFKFPPKVPRIEEYTFAGTNLTEVSIPSSVKYIGERAFKACKSLKKISIAGSVKEIGWLAFSECSSLQTVNMASGVTILGDQVFYDCDALTKIVLPNSINTMGTNIFEKCSNLREVVLPEYLTKIPPRTFHNCRKLEMIEIPPYVTTITTEAFAECDGLKTIVIPGNVQYIGQLAFWECSNLTTVSVPSNVNEIDYGAFRSCKNLHEVTIMNPELTISRGTFGDSENVSIRCFENSTAHTYAVNNKLPYEFLDISKVTDYFVDVPKGKWFVNSVQYVFDKELMAGSGEYFNPTKNVTRAQLVTTLYRLAGSPEVIDDSACTDFSDVEEGKYYTDAVCWAYNEGITTGSDGKFHTAANLTRQQMAAFFFRYAAVMGYDVSANADFSAMLNADKVSEYAVEAIQWAVGAGLISGSETKDEAGNVVYDLNPKGNTTRAQLSAILQRFCAGFVDVETPDNTDELPGVPLV